MSISLIVAVNENFAIGNKNELLYHIKDDLLRFKELTSGNFVVMGRKTFESLPKPFKQGRTNVILTREEDYKVDSDADILICNDLTKVLNQYKFTGKQDRDMFIIGGGEIYAEAIHWCDNIYLTMVHDDKEGDTYFPKQELSMFKKVSCEKHLDEASGLYFTYINYERKCVDD